MKNLKIMTLILTLIMLLSMGISFGDAAEVVSIANDIDMTQRQEMLDIFGVDESEVRMITVTNQEERKYLEGIAPDEQIGNSTISSAYVQFLDNGSGIEVETHNITWVTEEMYESALVTAGVKDAKIMAAAPFPVSGTGALTGIIKGFEVATGETISDEQKRVANEEMVVTGELGEEIGKDEATNLIVSIKEELVGKNIKDREDIKQIIIDISGRLDINLNTNQIEDLTNLMEKIGGLNLDTEQIKNQLEGIGNKLNELVNENQEVRSLLERILDAIKDFFNSIFG